MPEYLPNQVLLASKATIKTNEGIFIVSQFIITKQSIERVFYTVEDIIDWNDVEDSDENIRIARIFDEDVEEVGIIIIDNYQHYKRIGYFKSYCSSYLRLISEHIQELYCDQIISSPELSIRPLIICSLYQPTESDLISFLRPFGYDPLSI